MKSKSVNKHKLSKELSKKVANNSKKSLRCEGKLELKKKLRKTKHRNKLISYKKYFKKLNKELFGNNLTFSTKTLNVFDSFFNEMLEKFCLETTKLLRHSNKLTLTHKDIQTTVKLILPGELAKHAQLEGAKALNRYKKYISS